MDHAQNVFESPGTSTTYTNAPTVGWTRQLTPLVTLSLQAGLQFSTDGSVGAYANASYQIFSWLTARTSYSFSYQEQSTGNIPHNVVLVGLDISYPFRFDR